MFDLTNKTILVAGGAGYLGSQLCEDILLHNGNNWSTWNDNGYRIVSSVYT